jgi:hypothetical protein
LRRLGIEKIIENLIEIFFDKKLTTKAQRHEDFRLVFSVSLWFLLSFKNYESGEGDEATRELYNSILETSPCTSLGVFTGVSGGVTDGQAAFNSAIVSTIT